MSPASSEWCIIWLMVDLIMSVRKRGVWAATLHHCCISGWVAYSTVSE